MEGLVFRGAWTEQNPGIVYKAASLSFSDLPVSGGSAYATGTDGIGNALLYRPLAAPLNGTYYGSFLSSCIVSNYPAGTLVNIGISHGGFSNPFPHAGNYAITTPGFSQGVAVSAGSVPTQSGAPLNNDRTYLTLFKIDTAAQSNKAWVLTAEQYDLFKTGGLTEAELDAAPVGEQSGQVWGRASVNYTGPIPLIASNLSVFLNASGGVSSALAVDELRLSSASLDEATLGSFAKPVLQIAKSGNIMLLVWNTNFPGFTLEQADSPDATNWVTTANSPISVADNFIQPINMSTSTFFRLRKKLP